ncbi:MAG: hypothetical protein PHQ19_08820, partial [Candidatus Krumholzibacteria bacterium]|nr:hypothetical protein [Candidatus Krumholzibacteria bacterium]
AMIVRYGEDTPGARQYSLAVMDFRDLTKSDDPTVSMGITELVSTGLIQSDMVRVVSSERLHDLRRQLFGSPRGAIDDSEVFELARRVEATLFLVGTIEGSGAGRVVIWRLVDARNGDNVGSARAEGAEPVGIADQIIAEVVSAMTRALGVAAKEPVASVESITTDNPRAYQHYTAALLASEESRTGDAIAELERAVKLDSTFALAYMQLGREYRWFYSGKQYEYFDRAWSLRSRLGIKDRMRLEAERENIGRSIAILREMRERWPDDRRVLIDLRDRLGTPWYDIEAIRISEEGLRFYPDDPIIGGAEYLHLLVNAGRADEALRLARSHAERHPEELTGWRTLGYMFIASGLPDSARAAFDRAVRIDPRSDPDDEFGIVVAYHSGDLSGAIARIEAVTGRDNLRPAHRWALMLVSHQNPPSLARLYIEAGRYREMREATREYWEPGSVGMLHTRLLVAMGCWQEIVDLYDLRERMAREDTTLAPFYPRDLGKALAELGDAGRARETAAGLRGIEFEAGAMVIHDANEIEARAALSEGDPKTALKFLGEMKRNGVPFGGCIDIDYRTTLARAYRMDGRLETAAGVHEEMLRIYGGHALSHYELGAIYEQMRRPADAKREYAKFLEMWSGADEDLPQLIDARARLAAL